MAKVLTLAKDTQDAAKDTQAQDAQAQDAAKDAQDPQQDVAKDAQDAVRAAIEVVVALRMEDVVARAAVARAELEDVQKDLAANHLSSTVKGLLESRAAELREIVAKLDSLAGTVDERVDTLCRWVDMYANPWQELTPQRSARAASTRGDGKQEPQFLSRKNGAPVDPSACRSSYFAATRCHSTVAEIDRAFRDQHNTSFAEAILSADAPKRWYSLSVIQTLGTGKGKTIDVELAPLGTE